MPPKFRNFGTNFSQVFIADNPVWFQFSNEISNIKILEFDNSIPYIAQPSKGPTISISKIENKNDFILVMAKIAKLPFGPLGACSMSCDTHDHTFLPDFTSRSTANFKNTFRGYHTDNFILTDAGNGDTPPPTQLCDYGTIKHYWMCIWRFEM